MMTYIQCMYVINKYDLSKNPENIHRSNTINMYICILLYCKIEVHTYTPPL